MGIWFDRYEIKARLAPAIVVFLPLLFGAYILFPVLLDISTALFGLVIIVALSTLIANISRSIGKKKESALFEKWDGMPTTRFLRHRDIEIDPITKQRYHEYLEAKVVNLTLPKKDEELENTECADLMYASGVNWLRQNNSEDNNLILSSNIAYGFARNLWAMKQFAIFICMFVIIGSLSLVFYRYGLEYQDVPVETWWFISFTTVMLFVWIFIVRPEWVHDKAKAYAKALLQTCEDTSKAS